MDMNKCDALLQLSQRTGYDIIQSNGQRVYGPPPNWEGPRPRKGSEIFIGKIPRNVYEDELVPVLELAGRIYEMRLMMDYGGYNRGYAFATYFTPEEAQTALNILQNYEIRRGRQLGIYASVDNCRLFIGGIPTNRQRAEVLEALSELVEGIVDIIMYQSPNNPARNRGYIFVEFASHRFAAMARRQLYYGTALWDTQLMVDWADPIPVVEPNVMRKVKAHFCDMDEDGWVTLVRPGAE